MLVRELQAALDRRFPFENAAAWDPVGVQIGGLDRPVGHVAVCHEVTDAAIDTAVELDVTTLVTYHPLLFSPTTELLEGPGAQGRALRLASHRMNLIVVHTAMDAATPGTGDALLDALGLPASGSFALMDGVPGSAIGRVATLPEPMATVDLIERMNEVLGSPIRCTQGPSEVQTIAVVPGSGGFAIPEAAILADALVTGDVSHHQATAGVEQQLMVLDAGHAATERPGVAALYSSVCEELSDATFIEYDPTPWEA